MMFLVYWTDCDEWCQMLDVVMESVPLCVRYLTTCVVLFCCGGMTVEWRVVVWHACFHHHLLSCPCGTPPDAVTTPAVRSFQVSSSHFQTATLELLSHFHTHPRSAE